MKDIERIIWGIAIIVAVGLGVIAGHAVTAKNAGDELTDLQAQLETANASLAESNIELAFWQNMTKGLAEGGQLEGIDLRGRPSTGD